MRLNVWLKKDVVFHKAERHFRSPGWEGEVAIHHNLRASKLVHLHEWDFLKKNLIFIISLSKCANAILCCVWVLVCEVYVRQGKQNIGCSLDGIHLVFLRAISDECRHVSSTSIHLRVPAVGRFQPCGVDCRRTEGGDKAEPAAGVSVRSLSSGKL